MTPFTSAHAVHMRPSETIDEHSTAALEEIGGLASHGPDGDLWNLTGSDYSRDAAWADHAWQ
ncbi:hypothetical protein D477_014366 [Arthrobacter crystallopoietes BAB-32]|uniref:Uncharacterized protein n=1 Tax=Arthrobacter crystallopoietes BAB-32 TaxID=1246476 RepID=N1UWU5_9MICC|nr:hypothetical protein [Arthrobacter crystallopoietes]EMY33545.1 hypothetical protein D477_014366 [Arthrobacter crystallopoietes BAB-32]